MLLNTLFPSMYVCMYVTYISFLSLLVSTWLSGSPNPQQAMEVGRVVRRRGSDFFLDNRLTDGDEIVNLTHRPSFTPRKIPGTHFC
jgi:hypothetical protein